MNYLETSNKKKQLDNLLGTYNLTSTVYFPTRIANNCVTLIDNIFIDKETTPQPWIKANSDERMI
jgi:hypothetical protein